VRPSTRKAIYLLSAILFASTFADAHAVLLHSMPSPNQVVNGKTIPIELRFNSRVDAKRSKLTLIDRAGSARDLVIEQSSRDSILSRVKELLPG